MLDAATTEDRSAAHRSVGGSSDGGPLLDVSHVSISFGGVRALVDVSLGVGAGEAVGLVGPNGAGKTTLFNCICGQLRPSSGTVSFDGQPLDGVASYRRARLGIARTFQRVEVFPEMTPREHVVVAERARAGDGSLWRDLVGRGRPTAAEWRRADELVDLVGLGEVADTPVAALSLGRCRLVELARALAVSPRLLLADEPSSGLDTAETAAIADLLRRIQRDHGTAVLLVEHDLQMVRRAVDRVVVLDFGTKIAEGSFDEVVADPAVRQAYLGRTA